MKIIYLDSALTDLEWLRAYYEAVFPEGAAAAYERLANAHALLSANPHIGRPSNNPTHLRILPIARTPFQLVYRITRTHIEILHVRDSRGGIVE